MFIFNQILVRNSLFQKSLQTSALVKVIGAEKLDLQRLRGGLMVLCTLVHQATEMYVMKLAKCMLVVAYLLVHRRVTQYTVVLR